MVMPATSWWMRLGLSSLTLCDLHPPIQELHPIWQSIIDGQWYCSSPGASNVWIWTNPLEPLWKLLLVNIQHYQRLCQQNFPQLLWYSRYWFWYHDTSSSNLMAVMLLWQSKEEIVANVQCIYTPMNLDLPVDIMLKEMDDVKFTTRSFPNGNCKFSHKH